MAEKNPQAKSKTDIKSGVTLDAFEAVLGGLPGKKSVEEIEKENTPKKAPESVRS